MKIFYNNNELDSDKEWEHINTQYGFMCLCKLTKLYEKIIFDINIIHAESEGILYCNVTEIHNKYRNNSIAFESDIHSTGCTIQHENFDYIIIFDANKMYSSFYGDDNGDKLTKQFIRKIKLDKINC